MGTNQEQFSNFDNQQNDNQQNNNFDQQNNNFDQQNNNHAGDDGIQIENMEFSNNEKTNQPMQFNEMPESSGQGMDWNQMDSNPMGNSDEIDDEERNRIQARKEEEEARRAKIMKKMND